MEGIDTCINFHSFVQTGIVSSSSDTTPNATPTTNTTPSSGLWQLPTSDLSSDLLETDLHGVCGCGGCTVRTLLQDLPCPQPTSSPALYLPLLREWGQAGEGGDMMSLVRLFLEYKALANR